MLETPLQPQSSVPPALRAPAKTVLDPFVFVPVTGNEAAKGRGATKRIVRAHVSRVQHAKNSALGGANQNRQSWTVRPYVHRDPVAIRRKPRAIASSSRRPYQDGSEEYADEELIVGNVPRLEVGSTRDDPFWTYPIDFDKYLHTIFQHYITNVAVEIPDIDGPNEKGLLRRSWFPLAMTSAATMYAVLLMAASHYCIVCPSEASRYNLLHLKARALAEINAAFVDPKRCTSDALIGAVMKMAAYEAVFGESKVFVQHMKGLAVMLKMRGGLSKLGLNGLLERMVVWIDLNASHITGQQKRMLADEFATVATFTEPDPFHFAGIS